MWAAAVLQIEAWLSECGVCIPVYRYSMTRYHDSFMRWYCEKAAHRSPPDIQQTAATSASSEPAGVGASHAGHDCQAVSEAAGGDSSKVSSECALAAAAHTAAHDSASATHEAAADATEGADPSADSVIEGSESAPPAPAVTWEGSEPMLSDSALEEAAGAELEETVDRALAQLIDELITAAVAEFLALSDGASQPADPTMAAIEVAPANVHDSFSDPTHGSAESAGISPAAVVAVAAGEHGTVESSGISPAAVVAVAAGTGSVCQSDGAIHGSSAPTLHLLPHSDFTVSPPTAEGCNTVSAYNADAYSAEAQNAEGQAAHSHSADARSPDAHSPDAAQDADAHAHSAAVYSADGQHAQHQAADGQHAQHQAADGQHAQHQAAGAHIAQAQPAEADSAEAIKAEAGDAETHSLAGDTAQAHTAEACSKKADTAAACTFQVSVAAVQLVEPDDSAVAADITPAFSAPLPGTSSTDSTFAATAQAVTTAAPEDAAPSDTQPSDTQPSETQPQVRQLADSQPTESAPLELTHSPEVTHSAAESAENSVRSAERQPQAALILSRLQLQLHFMHEREGVREREMEQMRQRVTEVEDACKVAVAREVGYRKDQNARLQSGKQVRYGPHGELSLLHLVFCFSFYYLQSGVWSQL